MSILDHAYDPQRRVSAPVHLPVPKVNWNPWTVGDLDRVAFMEKRRDYTAEDISTMLSGSALATTPERIRELAEAFDISLRQPTVKAVRS